MELSKWKCKFCGGEDFALMDTTLMVFIKKEKIEEPYYYHYSTNYEKGCRQRIPYKDIFKYAEVVLGENEK